MSRTAIIAVVVILASGTAAFGSSKCTALKYTFAGKAALLKAKCYAKAFKKGVTADQECLDKAEGFLTTKLAKAESKDDCLTIGDGAALQADVDAFLLALETDLGPPTICGNDVREGLEQCDGTDDANCSFGGCDVDCACSGTECLDLDLAGRKDTCLLVQSQSDPACGSCCDAVVGCQSFCDYAWSHSICTNEGELQDCMFGLSVAGCQQLCCAP